jgi:hypothetical protein
LSSRRDPLRSCSLMLFFDDFFIVYPALSNHEKSQIPDDVGNQNIIIDLIAVDVQTKSLPLQASSVRKSEVEIENHSLVGHTSPVKIVIRAA